MIRPALVAWRDVTVKLSELTRKVAENERDETIAGIEALLDDREKLQSHITAPFTAEEEQFGKELVVLEAEVQKKLVLFTKLIRTEITDTQAKKENVKSYINPYSNIGNDGAYYDTKQ